MKIYEKNRLPPQLAEFLLAWYDNVARDLPWRRNITPYSVWLSEIMLQQTRVESVIPYYLRFLERVPNINALANIPEEQLLKLWEGLGYYSRARNLKKAAQQICELHDGVFPTEYPSVLALSGVGEYTAGAICSICYNLPTPAVDGNVLRVISRLLEREGDINTASEKAAVRVLLEAVYPTQRAGDFTQSLMELGATVCLPRSPQCLFCPIQAHCSSFADKRQAEFPVKSAKKARRIEQKTFFIVYHAGSLALCKREPNGLLGGMWQLPNVTGHLSAQQAKHWLEQQELGTITVRAGAHFHHLFTHVDWDVHCWEATCSNEIERYTWVLQEELEETVALPTAFKTALK